jgi:hypothetical protein
MIGVGDCFAATGTDAALEADDLRDDPIVARQGDANAVQERQQVTE